MRVVCVALLFLALIAPTCTCSSTASASTLDAGDTTPLRSLQDEKVVFPRVYTALVPPPKSDDDIAVHFVAQVDLLDVKEISSTEDSSVRVTFLVHGADELAVLTELLAKVNDSINSINIQLDLEQTRGFQVQADSSPPDNENVFASRQQTTYSTISGYSCYRDLQGSFDWMNDMVTKAELIPNLSVTLADIGDSHIKTVNPTGGHDIMAMKITGAPSTGDKAIFFAMSGIHAREYSPPETLMRWAEQLVDAYGNDADLSAMLDHTEIHLVIQTNPDGRAEAETQRPLFRRKNLNRGASASLCGSGQYGVDLNRNFPFRWGLDSGSSSNECSQTYRGTAPASEPEVQAVVNYCLGIFPEGQRKANPISQQQQPYNVETTMGIFFDIHSFGEVMIWPWGYQELETANDFEYEALANKYRAFNGYAFSAPFNGYLYAASGATDDWAHSNLGAAAMTFELGTTFYQSCNYFQSSILDRSIKSLNYAAKVAMAPYSLSQGPDLTRLFAVVVEDELFISADASDSAFSYNFHPTARQEVAEIRYYINEHPYDAQGAGSVLGAIGVSSADVSSLSVGRHMIYLQATDEDGFKGPVTAAYFEILDAAPDPATTAPTASPFACFSGETTVLVKDKGATLMKNLQVGDLVLVSEDGTYEPVYSFGHRTTTTSGQYMQLHPSMLELSPDHMVFLERKGTVPAGSVQVGDSLIGGVPVTDIRTVVRKGVFAPFTPSGRIVVNGVLASSYISFQKSPVLMVGQVSTGLSYQWLSHVSLLPHRIVCYHMGICRKERYTDTGVSEWLARPLKGFLWFLGQSPLLEWLLLVPLLLVIGILAVVEIAMHLPGTTLTLICIVVASKARNPKSI